MSYDFLTVRPAFWPVLIRVLACFWATAAAFVTVAAFRQARRADVREALYERANRSREHTP